MTCHCPFGVLPSLSERTGLWLHGTGEDAAQAIAREGLIRPASQEQRTTYYQGSALEPLEERIYLTRDPVFALAFVILRRGDRDSYKAVYILEVEGENLVDVEPDEDAVGTALLRAKHPWLNRLALSKLKPDLWTEHPIRFAVDFEDLWRSFGMTAAPLGKLLLSKLSSEERRMFLNLTEVRNVAHVGPLPVSGGLRVPLPDDKDQFYALYGLSCGLWSRFRKWAQPVLKTAERVF